MASNFYSSALECILDNEYGDTQRSSIKMSSLKLDGTRDLFTGQESYLSACSQQDFLIGCQVYSNIQSFRLELDLKNEYKCGNNCVYFRGEIGTAFSATSGLSCYLK